MTVTARNLTRAAAVCAAAAGAIFIAVQIHHPPTDSFLTDTNEWVIRCTAKAVMGALALAGITGIYLRQVRQMRVLGLVGFVFFAAGYLLLFATEVMAVVRPARADREGARLRQRRRRRRRRCAAHRRHRPPADPVQPHRYLLHARRPHLRHRTVPRPRSGPVGRLLLAVSTVATAALAVLPESFNRPLAVPEGVALIALGVSLWRDQQNPVAAPVPHKAAGEQLAVR